MNPIFSHRILELPLFQGLGRADLESIMGRTKFGFSKIEAGKIVVKEDDACNQLYFLLKGRLQADTYSVSRHYTFTEFLNATAVLQPENLFGLTQRYSKTFTAVDECQFLTLHKDEVIRLSNEYFIFRLNLLGYIATCAQKLERLRWRTSPHDLRQRLVCFFEQHSMRPAGEKSIKIKMTDLAQEVCDSRLNVSRALNDLQAEGLLELHRGRIHIPKLENILQ